MRFFREQRYPALACLILGLGIGFLSGYSSGKVGVENAIKQSLQPINESGTSYKFVRPLLAYRTPEATLFGEYISLKADLQARADKTKSTGASRVSIYFRDLDAAQWIGIDQQDSYYPASLLKVPTMIAYYKEAEVNPSILRETLSYDPRIMPSESFSAPSVLVPSNLYSVKDLIRSMIIDSDNGATFTLLSRINPNFLHAVYVALGIPDPGDNSADYQISARTYGLFFRVLYNASYLSPDYSEQALKLLSQTTFTEGLVAGVPEGTQVAHKYGEHILSENGLAKGVELSDCGIIYYPAHPYLLCVMTSAASESSAQGIIADISRIAYTAVSEHYAATTSK